MMNPDDYFPEHYRPAASPAVSAELLAGGCVLYRLGWCALTSEEPDDGRRARARTKRHRDPITDATT
jgi:hypothetical protein